MNNFDRAIAEAICRYPGLYESRASVLHHWFCVIGNGMDWIDGKLQNVYPEAFREPEEVKNIDLSKDSWEIAGDIKHNLSLAKQAMIKGNADLIALLPWELSTRLRWIYPMDKKYSKLACFPDNIHPEYLQGIVEMIEIIFSTDCNQGYNWAERSKSQDTEGDSTHGLSQWAWEL
jgi:hypothetical protein